MLVKVLSFGTNWWARFGHDPQDPYRFTRHAAYYNSTGVRCGHKVRRHWIVPGLIRFNGVGSFDPHLPNRSIGKTFRCSGPTFALGGNRLLLGTKASKPDTPDFYLLVVTSDQHGRINMESDAWKSPFATVIAASQLRNAQEAMLLMKVGDWVQTDCGVWQLMASEKAQALVALELIGDQVSA